MHTINFPIKGYQGLLFVTWKWTWCEILICFLPKEECQITISHTWFCHRRIGIITNISRFNYVTMYRHNNLIIQKIQFFIGHLMGFIYALRLICRVDIILWTCGREHFLQDQKWSRYICFDQHCWKYGEGAWILVIKF